MGILIGMDEAGYGPNYGPLVVAATAWEVPDEGPGVGGQRSVYPEAASNRLSSPKSAGGKLGRSSPALHTPPSTLPTPRSSAAPDLYRLLRTVVAKKSSERRIAIADSKALYSPGLGLRQLERGLHAVLLALQQSLSCWSAIVEYCDADPDGNHKTACWPDGFNCVLPIDAAADELSRLSARFSRACDTAGVRPLMIRARLVFPAQFNDLFAHHGSKGAALSHITVGLLREVMGLISSALTSDLRPPTSTFAVCDKHGGRNFYSALLQHHFSEHWIEPVHESRAESRYEWGPPEARTRVAFRMNGERFLPTALASMTAKYLRELSIRAFNEFWSAHIADLRPTAGYPKDSHRFRQAIAAKQRELRIDDHVIWRNR
jgi:hypothetical protein